ncbi:glycerophosphodiester phosphodiesterase [Pelagibacterium sediminicola]|uniref:glycerophosphodiester phosphodiesterase n=1 Tax=Pelagibacterium sediminicola TaxID=2248761 RepID=UPI000E31F85C|nr:glycerophosphodiester phosphodiesterase family protein [Pelagibacterium sediminicola]
MLIIEKLPTRYSEGSATVVANEVTVTPTDALWYGNVWGDDLFFDPAQPLVPPQRIASVNEDGTLTLAYPWPGDTMTEAPYEVRYIGIIERSTAQTRRVLEELGKISPYYDVQVDTLADRDDYDDRPTGFAVLVADTGDGRSAIYSKNSAASGDWSDPAYVTGPAATLDVGSVTPVAFGNDPDVTLTPVAGGYEFDFEMPENATFQSGTITTLDPGEDATFSLSPVAGGYALNLGVPRGPAGDIDGVTPFWQGRITVDATAAQARAGLGAGDVSGPASAGDGHIALFDGTTGKLLKDSGLKPEDIGSVDQLFTDDLTAEFDVNEKAQARANIHSISKDASDVGDEAAQAVFRENIGAAPLRGPKVQDFTFAWMAHRGAPMYNPEETVASYSDCLARGFPMIEMDAHMSSDGNVFLVHSPTLDGETNGTGTVVSKSTSQLKSLSVKGYGSILGDGQPLATLSEVCEAFKDRAIFVIEGKIDGVIPRIMGTFAAHGVAKDQAIISDFTMSRLAPAIKEGYITEALKQTTSDLGEAQSFISDAITLGVDRLGVNHQSSGTVIAEYVSSGLPVSVFTVDRRIDRDRVLGLGVAGIYTDDPVYVSADAPLFTEDQFHLQSWLPGMLGASNGRDVRARGRFFDGGWGWPTVPASSPDFNTLAVLQGWACPVVENPATDSFEIEFTAEFYGVANTGRWFGIFVADESMLDAEIINSITLSLASEKSISGLIRQTGAMELYVQTGTTIVGSGSSSSAAISLNNPVHVRFTVTPSSFTMARLDAPGGNVTHSVSSSDASHRGAYFHLAVNEAAVKFSNVKVIAL